LNRYHLYHRVSKEIQAVEGHGIQRQEQGSELWIQQYNKQLIAMGQAGFVMGQVYEDRGKSAYTAANFNKGQLGVLMDDIKNGVIAKGDLIVIELIDRFSRADTDFVRKKFQTILDAGVKIAITKWNLVFEEKMAGIEGVSARMLLEIGMYLANQESSLKSARIKASRRLMENTGKKSNAKGPFWLARTPDLKSYTVIEENAEIVRTIFDLKLKHNFGAKKIVKHFQGRQIQRYKYDDLGVLVKSSQNSELSESTVNLLIRNPNVIGLLNDEQYYPAIVDEKVYYAAQKKIHESTGGSGDVFRNVFVNIGKCGCLLRRQNSEGHTGLEKCGYTMAYASRKAISPSAGQYLKCNNKRKTNRCSAKSINYYLAQNKVYNVLRALKYDEERAIDTAHLEEKLNQVLKKLTKIQELIVEYPKDRTWREQYDKQWQAKERIESEIRDSKSRISNKISSLDLDFEIEKDRILFNQILKDNKVTIDFVEDYMTISIGSLNNFYIKCGYEENERDISEIVEKTASGYRFEGIELLNNNEYVRPYFATSKS